MKNAHAILGVSPNASLEEIKQAYIKRTRIVHPDRFDPDTDDWRSANNMLRELNEAYGYLRKIHQTQSQPRPSQPKQSAQQPKQDAAQQPKQNARRESTTPPPSEEPPHKHSWEDPNFEPHQPESGYHHNAQDQEGAPFPSFLLWLLIVAIIIFSSSLLSFYGERSSASSINPSRSSAAATYNAPQTLPRPTQTPAVQIASNIPAPSRPIALEPNIRPEIDEPEIKLPPEQPIPESGTYWNSTDEEEEAPFTIMTRGTGFYYIKLVTLKNETAMEFFVHAGDTVEFNVPFGRYQMRYATGEKWYGEEELFGPFTSCSKSDNIFNFNISNNQISGYSVTLYKVPGGNMRTQSIPMEEF